jgi:iron complex outermembrane receptor protein
LVKDKLIISGNGDNGGSVQYEKTNPVIGAVFKINPSFNLYANYGTGFETPTFIEAAYNGTGANATPNLTLKPSTSQNMEVGAKAFVANNTQVNLSLFKITTKNELIVAATADGRTSYINANDTKRTGAELSIDSRFENNISTYVSYSLLNAEFDSSTTNIAAGNKIPGTYSNQIYAELAWKYQPLGFSTAVEGRYNSKVYVSDRNNSDFAPSYKIANIRAGFEQNVGGWNFTEFVRVENIFDKDYIGSVRINDSNLRFFEPAADRNYLLSVGATYKF